MSNITMTNTDPGEGSPLEKDEYVAVYGDGGKFTEDDIADNAISTSKIKNGAVNKEKLASDAIYVLPTASETTLGGVKVGKNLAIDANGVLSASAEPYNLPTASNTTLGGVKVGNNLKIDGQGVLSAEAGGAQISVTDVDPGEGEPLDENNYVAVYGEDSLIKGEDIAKNTVTSDNIDWTTMSIPVEKIDWALAKQMCDANGYRCDWEHGYTPNPYLPAVNFIIEVLKACGVKPSTIICEQGSGPD